MDAHAKGLQARQMIAQGNALPFPEASGRPMLKRNEFRAPKSVVPTPGHFRYSPPMPNVTRRDDLARLAEYPVLLTRVRETFVLGQQKAKELKVQTYWEAGRLIHEHLQHHQNEAGYPLTEPPSVTAE
jgi:hypothetical protein